MNSTIKKAAVAALSAVMLTSGAALTAFAADGPMPNHTPEDMPAWGNAYVGFERTPSQNGTVFSGGDVFNENVEGVTYDADTNTLTLNNVKLPDSGMNVHMMGDDFKLNVVGECELGVIYVNDYEYSTSLTITGKGTLDLNKNNTYYYSVYLFGGQEQKALNIDSSVTVNMYSSEESDTLVRCSNLRKPDPDTIFFADGQPVRGFTGAERTFEQFETESCAMVVHSMNYIGQEVTCFADPEGMYTKTVYVNRPDEIYVKHYIHYDELDIYDEEAGYGGRFSSSRKLTPEEFAMEFCDTEQGGNPVSVYNHGILSKQNWNVYYDADGTRYLSDYSGNIYSFSEDKSVTIKVYDDNGDTYEKVHYLPELLPDLTADDLISSAQTVHTGEYDYTLSGTEYHHEGNDEPQTYDLWVNNEQFTEYHLTVQCGEGTATFDPESCTLTLDNAQITQGAEKDYLYTGILDFLDDELTIVVNGNCSITETGGDGIGSYEFDENWSIVPHDITVTGDGKLTITESTEMYGYGFYCTGELTLDGVDLEIDSAATGVWAKSLNVKDSTIDIDCCTRFSGFVVNSGAFRFENSTAYAQSAEGAGLLLGNDVDSSTLEMVSGTLTLRGKVGIDCEENVNSTVVISGGKLDVAGTEKLFETLTEERFTLGENIAITSGGFDQNSIVFEDISASSLLIGDADENGRVDIRDVTAIQRHLADIDLLTGNGLKNADTNGDSNVTVEDATLIQQYLAEFTDSL